MLVRHETRETQSLELEVFLPNSDEWFWKGRRGTSIFIFEGMDDVQVSANYTCHLLESTFYPIALYRGR